MSILWACNSWHNLMQLLLWADLAHWKLTYAAERQLCLARTHIAPCRQMNVQHMRAGILRSELLLVIEPCQKQVAYFGQSHNS